jgi:hypothetical protein
MRTDRHDEDSNFAHAPKSGNITSEIYVWFRSRYYITISLKRVSKIINDMQLHE